LLTASIALLLMAPALAVIAAAVRLTGPGPVVVPVMRVGKDGREFRMLRFRTRTVTAEHARASQLGFWLLRLGLDELPAVLNIWRGELSLFGPRPAWPGGSYFRMRPYLYRVGARAPDISSVSVLSPLSCAGYEACTHRIHVACVAWTPVASPAPNIKSLLIYLRSDWRLKRLETRTRTSRRSWTPVHSRFLPPRGLDTALSRYSTFAGIVQKSLGMAHADQTTNCRVSGAPELTFRKYPLHGYFHLEWRSTGSTG